MHKLLAVVASLNGTTTTRLTVEDRMYRLPSIKPESCRLGDKGAPICKAGGLVLAGLGEPPSNDSCSLLPEAPKLLLRGSEPDLHIRHNAMMPFTSRGVT